VFRTAVALAVMLAVMVPGWQALQYWWRLGLAPAGLDIWLVLYSQEETWGFGPGGNETGVIVYKLPEAAATRVAAGGAPYLTTLSNASESAGRGRYQNWRATPISGDEQWLYGDTGARRRAGYRASIDDFLDRYGFRIEIDAAAKALIDEALSSSGSYYAYGAGGSLVIVAPRVRRVILAYAG
jgi:hypothetical protein